LGLLLRIYKWVYSIRTDHEENRLDKHELYAERER